MYFPFCKLQAGGQRFAARPQTIYSEFPEMLTPICYRKIVTNARGRSKVSKYFKILLPGPLVFWFVFLYNGMQDTYEEDFPCNMVLEST